MLSSWSRLVAWRHFANQCFPWLASEEKCQPLLLVFPLLFWRVCLCAQWKLDGRVGAHVTGVQGRGRPHWQCLPLRNTWDVPAKTQVVCCIHSFLHVCFECEIKTANLMLISTGFAQIVRTRWWEHITFWWESWTPVKRKAIVPPCMRDCVVAPTNVTSTCAAKPTSSLTSSDGRSLSSQEATSKFAAYSSSLPC